MNEGGFDGTGVLIDKVASNLFVFVLNAEELQDDLAEAVRAQRSLKRLVAAAVQPRHRPAQVERRRSSNVRYPRASPPLIGGLRGRWPESDVSRCPCWELA